MPEAGPAPGAPRELVFVDLPGDLQAGTPWLGFGAVAAPCGATPSHDQIAIGPLLRPDRDRLRSAFVHWLGALNISHASPQWWAFTTSAKNLLASRFGNAVFELLALKLLLDDSALPRIGVVGAGTGQVAVMKRLAANSAVGLRVVDLRRDRASRQGPLRMRLFAQALRWLGWWARWFRPARSRNIASDVHVLTYADAGWRDAGDAFFGDLAALLARRSTPQTCLHHAYVHGDPAEVVPRFSQARVFHYAPLFAELRAADFPAGLAEGLAAVGAIERYGAVPGLEGLDFGPLLVESLRQDVAGGAYLAVRLARRAALRLAQRMRPAVFLYPFENKAMEKMILLGLREGFAACRIVGYQHTSVTPRHATLLFAPREAAATPLPDRIVTVGDVTLRYLSQHGNYPPGLLNGGFALRQKQRSPYERRPQGTPVRLLFALSSSELELAEAARWVVALPPDWSIALRPHPEFPLSRLPAALHAAVAARLENVSGSLEDSLRWADVVAYASSTVALEALMAGRPVVSMDLGEALDVDPVLEPVPLHWRAASPDELSAAVQAAVALSDEEFVRRRAETRAFVARYLAPASETGLGLLVGEKLSS